MGRDKLKKTETTKRIKAQISSAYVSIAELFLTDLCDAIDAQKECEKYLQFALEFDSDNVEAFATFAQFKLCQQNANEANKYFTICVGKCIGDQNTKMDLLSDDALSIDLFLKICKIGIELSEYEQTMLVLRNLVFVNDALGEIWALGALCLHKTKKNKEAAIWLNNAETILLSKDGSMLNAELEQTLKTIKSEMDMDSLPDFSSLKLEIDEDNDDEKEIDAFLLEDEDDKDIDL